MVQTTERAYSLRVFCMWKGQKDEREGWEGRRRGIVEVVRGEEGKGKKMRKRKVSSPTCVLSSEVTFEEMSRKGV